MRVVYTGITLFCVALLLVYAVCLLSGLVFGVVLLLIVWRFWFWFLGCYTLCSLLVMYLGSVGGIVWLALYACLYYVFGRSGFGLVIVVLLGCVVGFVKLVVGGMMVEFVVLLDWLVINSVVYSWSCYLLVLCGVLLFVYSCVCITVGNWLWSFAGCLGWGFDW